MAMLSLEIMFWKRSLHKYVHIHVFIHIFKALFKQILIKLGICISSPILGMALNAFKKERVLHLFKTKDLGVVAYAMYLLEYMLFQMTSIVS